MSLGQSPQTGLAQLVAAAAAAANSGRWDEAADLWREVRRAEPNHPQALFSLGIDALRRGEADEAEALIEAACQASPGDLLAQLALGAARRARGDRIGELAAINAVLSIDPYHVPGILAKAAWLERGGEHANAAMYYRSAVKAAPPEPHWPADLRQPLARAKQVAARHAEAVEAHLIGSVQEQYKLLAPAVAERWREAAAIAAGRSEPFVSQCNQFCVPRLPAIPFFDPSQFPWVQALEAKTAAIRAELDGALAQAPDLFTPYVAYPAGAPVNQWAELNHSQRWSGLHLWRNSQPVEENLARCPETAKALQAVGMAEIGGLCPNAMFSALAPHTHIPPHTGETNARVVAHLPLVVPERCSYRVGFEHRKWDVGKVLIFDDTIEHEARNESDELRVVLIFDIWNPLLTSDERSVAQAMVGALRDYHAGG